jgi:hypothetical protein
MLKIEIQGFKDLSDAERDEWSDEYANYLRVTHEGKTVLLTSDSMEPEDVRFTRDLKWIPRALQQVYDLGKADASR